MQKDRLQYIDIARGIGMICIILGHLGNSGLNRVVYTFHVPLFFILAGYFISEKKSMGEFIRNRARSLLVPYAVTSIVMVLIGIAAGIVLYGPIGIWQGVSWLWACFYGSGNSFDLLFQINSVGAIWFLLALFTGSVLFRCSLNMNKWIRAAFVLALFAAAYYTRNVIWLPFSLQPGMCSVMFIYVGWIVKRYKDRLRSVPLALKISALAVSAVLWGVFIYTYNRTFWVVRCQFGRGIPDIIMCLSACLAVIFISWLLEKVPFFGTSFALVGRYSLLVLCIHNIELNFFPWTQIMQALAGHGMPEGLVLPLTIVGKLAGCFLAAWLLLKIKPVRKLFRY